jgi:nitroreductase
MKDIPDLIRSRMSVRVPFDPLHPIAIEDLTKILEAGRWAPTAHNMQNYEIVVVDDPSVLESLGNLTSPVTETFLKENLELLSFSEEELRRRKVGLLGIGFPPDWTDLSKFEEAVQSGRSIPLRYTIAGSPLLLIVTYDPSKRAPDSEGDVLGLVSLGCLMENMWLMAESLGISVRIMSDFGDTPVTDRVKQALGVPDRLQVIFGLRLGYPKNDPPAMPRVRRDLADFVHHNRYGNMHE